MNSRRGGKGERRRGARQRGGEEERRRGTEEGGGEERRRGEEGKRRRGVEKGGDKEGKPWMTIRRNTMRTKPNVQVPANDLYRLFCICY